MITRLTSLLFPLTKVEGDFQWTALVEPEDAYTSIDALKFVFAQAEKKLDDSVKAIDITTAKSQSILTVSAGLVLAQSSYFFLHNDFGGAFSPKLCTVLFSCLWSLGVVLYIARNVQPDNYHTIGSYPSRLFTPDFFNKEIAGYTDKYLYVTEIQSYEVKIKQNFAINRTRHQRLRVATLLLLALPVAGLAFYGTVSLIVALL